MDFGTTVLNSARLRLQAFEPEDSAEIFAALTPAITRFMTFDPPPSLDAFSDIGRSWIRKMANRTDLFLVVRSASAEEFLGIVGLHNIGDPEREPEAGVWIKEAAHGCGYGREAVSILIGWAAHATDASGIVYPVAEQNVASRRVAEKLGGGIVGSRRLRKSDTLDHPMVVYRIPTHR